MPLPPAEDSENSATPSAGTVQIFELGIMTLARHSALPLHMIVNLLRETADGLAAIVREKKLKTANVKPKSSKRPPPEVKHNDQITDLLR
jgi:hypothetical protein